MSFSVTILGCGSAVPTSRRNPSSQYVVCSNRHILIDCGEGTQMQIRNCGIKLQKIEHVLISHLHGDHYFGLVGLLSTMHLLGRVKPIYIYGPEGLKEIIEIQLNYGGARLGFKVEFQVIGVNDSGLVFEDDKVCVQHFPLSHRIPTNGFVITEKQKERSLKVKLAQEDGVKIEYYQRLKQGVDVEGDNGQIISFKKYTRPAEPVKKYAYCSDTKYDESIVPFIAGVDLLYHEATFADHLLDRAIATAHSTASQAAKIAKLADVKKLLLGHLSARYETNDLHIKEAGEIFKNCEVVEDGDEFLV